MEALARYHSGKHRIDRAERAAYSKAWRVANPDKAKRSFEEEQQHSARFKLRYKIDPCLRKRKSAQCARWRSKNPQKVMNAILKKKYGITTLQHSEMMKSQGHRCAICGDKGGGDSRVFPHVDHCHTTKKVRGLLCRKCNHGIGLFKDDPEILRAAAAYLERSVKT